MENYHKFYLNITKYSGRISELQKSVFEYFTAIFSFTITIINLISILIICFQKGKFNILRKIQLILCVTFIGIEIRYYPIKLDGKLNIILDCACLSLSIISNYYQYIYSFIAYKLFTSPEDLLNKYSIFKIYVFPIILLIILNIFLNIDDTLHFKFFLHSYLDLSYYSQIILFISRLIFFLLNIIYIYLLLRKIKKISNIAIPIDKNFAKKKYAIYKSVLTWYIIGMSIVLMPYILLYSIKQKKRTENTENNDENELIKNYYFLWFFFGIECTSGFIYWVIYIYNGNLMKRFLIVFCCKKESDYLNDFIEEKRIYEDSVKSIITSNQTIDLSSLTSSINEEENKKQIKEEHEEHIPESLTEDETL